ncbi:MAG: DUF4157 domain-containing protein, partial [Chitinophagaceae bacterium]
MFSAVNKMVKSTSSVQQKAAGSTFFRKAGEEAFHGDKQSAAFFKAPIQAKLTVSTPDDPHEKEADAVADKVMRMPDPVAVTSSPVFIQSKADHEEKLHAKCTHCEAEDKQVNRTDAPEEEGEKKLSKKEASTSQIDTASTSAYIHSLNGKGQALPGSSQQFFGERMNNDFSEVRIHTGSEAEQSATAINAKAYTVDNHIVFNQGQYSPSSGEGKKLLAHELTHVVQQRNDKDNSPGIQRQAAPAPALTALTIANATPVTGHLADQFVTARNSPSGQVIVNANV